MSSSSTEHLSRDARALAPGPRGLPILGMLPAVRRNPTAVFITAARRFGDVVHLKIGPRHGYLITNPADVRHVLQDNARNYHKSPLYDKLRAVLGNGLLTSEDAFCSGNDVSHSLRFIISGSRRSPA